MRIIKNLFRRMRDKADALNRKNILSLLERDPDARLLDLGCHDGEWTQHLARQIGNDQLYGLEVNREPVREAELRGIQVRSGDLNEAFPFDDGFFDCVHANQVIEHLHDTDHFVSEIGRVLKPGGYCIVSTENLSSWCNILVLICGWQPFSLTNVSSKAWSLGNPFAIHHGEPAGCVSWQHIRVFSTAGLRALFTLHEFQLEELLGSGYFPFPAVLGNLDTKHAHFITLKAKKIKKT